MADLVPEANGVRSLADAIVPATRPEFVDAIRQVEDLLLQGPTVRIETRHVLHAGLYLRTIRIPPGVLITGALVKIPTVLIVQGDADMFVDGETRRLTGHVELQAAAGRKQMFVARTETWLTMAFATTARTVEEAEQEFTDEHERLDSRRPGGRSEMVVLEER